MEKGNTFKVGGVIYPLGKNHFYRITWDDGYGNKSNNFQPHEETITNNPLKWLEENNNEREEPETLEDFNIEKANMHIY